MRKYIEYSAMEKYKVFTNEHGDRLTEIDFLKWATIMYELYLVDDGRKNLRLSAVEETGLSCCLDTATGALGIAHCRKGDKFNTGIGCSIAYARMAGYPVPKMIEGKPIKDCVGKRINFHGTDCFVLPSTLFKNDNRRVVRLIAYETLKKYALMIDENTLIENEDIYD